MNLHRLKSLAGERITLASDDTFTLGIACRGAIEETTPHWLAATFSARTLRRLAATYSAHSSERAQIARALGEAL